MITTTDEDDCKVEHTEKMDMENTLLTYSQNHFVQTSNTPFCQFPLLQDFLMDVQSTNYDAVLNEPYVVCLNMDQYTKLLLKQMKGPSIPNKLPNYLSTSYYDKGWRKAREQTSSGISTLFILDITKHIATWQVFRQPLRHFQISSMPK